MDNLSCGGTRRNIYNGESTSYVGSAWNDGVSSLVVREGCRLDVNEHKNYGGKSRRFEGKVKRLKDFKMKSGSWGRNINWNDEITSWACSCDFTNQPLNCNPTESEITIKRCGNVNPGSMTCEYTTTQGMQMGTSVTQGRSISNTLEVSIGATFMEVFSAGLSASTTTTFDWSRTTSRTFNKATAYMVSCGVPPGATVYIKQVVGTCGDTAVYTEQYRCV